MTDKVDLKIDQVKREKISNYPISSGVLADIMGISQTALNKDHKDIPIMGTVQQGKQITKVYDLKEALRFYIDYLKGGGNKHTKAFHDIEVIKERKRKLRLENDETEGLMMDAETTIGSLQGIINALRAGADAMPPRLAQPLAAETNPRRVRKTLEEEINEFFGLATGVVAALKAALERGEGLGTKEPDTDNATDTDPSEAPNARPVGGREQDIT